MAEPMDDFDAVFVAEESAALMFEVMECRAFVAAKREYESAPVEDQANRAKDKPMLALVHELTYEAGIERVRQRKAQR